MHWSQWLRGLRRRSAATRLLRSWVRIPQGAWMFVCCECYVLPSRGLCDELITHPEESYRLWCVVVCDLETSRMRRPRPVLRHSAKERKEEKKIVNAQNKKILMEETTSTAATIIFVAAAVKVNCWKINKKYLTNKLTAFEKCTCLSNFCCNIAWENTSCEKFGNLALWSTQAR